MSIRHGFGIVSAICTVAVGLAVCPDRAFGQRPNGDGPRTSWGTPDLQGVWDFRTLTPLERPAALADKEFLTDEEAAAFEQETLHARDADRRDGAEKPFGIGADVERAYNQFWWDYGDSIGDDNRTSLVVDPSDGRIPYTPAGCRRLRRLVRQRRRRTGRPCPSRALHSRVQLRTADVAECVQQQRPTLPDT